MIFTACKYSLRMYRSSLSVQIARVFLRERERERNNRSFERGRGYLNESLQETSRATEIP